MSSCTTDKRPVITERAYETELVVVGGGIAGVTLALAAARHGAKVILIQDRPMLGGNASSEVRMMIAGAHGKDNRETGILALASQQVDDLFGIFLDIFNIQHCFYLFSIFLI